MSDISAAAKAAEAVARVFQPVTESTFGLLRDLAGPGAKELGEWVGDLVRIRRQRLAVLEQLLQDELQQRGVTARVIDPEFLLSVCEAACRVRDDELSQLWARLLASGVADDDGRHPLWIDTLRSMSTTDARVFEWLRRRNGMPLHFEGDEDPCPVPDDRLFACIARLRALQLVDYPDNRQYGGALLLQSAPVLVPQPFVVTDVGEQFAALVMPSTDESEEGQSTLDDNPSGDSNDTPK